METVHISRDSEGFFLWPKGLPEFVPGSPLTVAANVLEHGTGALNIDGCRVPTDEDLNGGTGMNQPGKTAGREFVQPAGRWPANLIHDGSAEVLAGFPQSSAKNGVTQGEGKGGIWSKSTGKRAGPTHGDAGSAARFFYCAKASKNDRGEGNAHPTVKPTELMRYLCRLVTPPCGTVLDPFMGSGSTGKAALLEGFAFIGAEREQESFDTAAARIGFTGSAHIIAAVEVTQMELI
jgi:site-specific DNA-methyltransferase (adenine-specific)